MTAFGGWNRLPEVARIGDVDPSSYLYNWCERGTLVAISMIHQQAFRNYRDMIVRDDIPNAGIDDWVVQVGDLVAVQSVVNRIDIWDLVEADDELSEYLANWLCLGWTRTVKSQFPELEIVVDVNKETNGYGVTLFRVF